MKKTVFVVSYGPIDYWYGASDRAMLDLLVSDGLLPCSLINAGRAFIEAGWEGDGEIVSFWLPPFMFPSNPMDFVGVHVWHVKQNNNGISFLCARHPFRFPAFDDNDKWLAVEVEEPDTDPNYEPYFV